MARSGTRNAGGIDRPSRHETLEGGVEQEMYERVTRGIRIAVEPDYLDDQSDPDEDRYIWAYTVRIANESGDCVQLRSRTWCIVDSSGRTETVYGEGVIGQQPVIQPGEEFVYTSGAPLTTPSGLMHGTYDMETPDGERFEVDIPAFSLDSPHELRSVH